MKTLAYIALIAAAVFLAYGNSLLNGFVWDDHDAILYNNFITQQSNLPKLASREYFQLSRELTYRPLVTLTYFLDYSFWELTPAGYHLSNLLLHFAACLALFLFARGLFKNSAAAFAAALIFAVHPVNTEAVNVPAFREDLMAGLFALTALAARRKSMDEDAGAVAGGLFYGLSLMCFLAALFSKEMALALPLVMVAQDMLFARESSDAPLRRNRPARYAGYAAALAFYAAIRFVFMRNPAEASTPFLGGNLFAAAASAPKIFAGYATLLFLPFNLSAKYDIAPTRNIFEPDTLLSAFFIAACLWHAWRTRKTRPIEAFAITAFFISLLPVSNIVPIVNPVAERYLYLPCAFFCLFAASALARLALVLSGKMPSLSPAKMRFVQACPLLAVSLVFAATSAIRNADWRDSLAIWSKTARRFPNHPDVLHELGDWHRNNGDLQAAMDYYGRALAVNPNHTAVRVNLGVIYETLGLLDQALEQYNAALAVSPGMSKIHNNIAIIHSKKGDMDRSIAEFQKAVEMDPYYPEPYVNMAIIYREQGRLDESMAITEKALAVAPNSSIVKLQAGRLNLLLGDEAKAMSYFNDLLARGQETAAVRYSLGYYYLENMRPAEALAEFAALLALNPADASLHFAAGRACEMAGQPDKAVEHYRSFLDSGQAPAEQAAEAAAALERLRPGGRM